MATTDFKVKVLFLSKGNSCCSQMAEGWARALKGEELEVWSAGIETQGLDSNAVRVMHEAGVDISNHESKHLFFLQHIPFDYVVMVDGQAYKSCPIFPITTDIFHVDFDDPAELTDLSRTEEETLEHYRRVRDEIRVFVEGLPDNLFTD